MKKRCDARKRDSRDAARVSLAAASLVQLSQAGLSHRRWFKPVLKPRLSLHLSSADARPAAVSGAASCAQAAWRDRSGSAQMDPETWKAFKALIRPTGEKAKPSTPSKFVRKMEEIPSLELSP